MSVDDDTYFAQGHDMWSEPSYYADEVRELKSEGEYQEERVDPEWCECPSPYAKEDRALVGLCPVHGDPDLVAPAIKRMSSIHKLLVSVHRRFLGLS